MSLTVNRMIRSKNIFPFPFTIQFAIYGKKHQYPVIVVKCFAAKLVDLDANWYHMVRNMRSTEIFLDWGVSNGSPKITPL